MFKFHLSIWYISKVGIKILIIKLLHFLTAIFFFYKEKKALAINHNKCCHMWPILFNRSY